MQNPEWNPEDDTGMAKNASSHPNAFWILDSGF
jgi:hypothetical protein